ncbi:MAG: hypothetical protein J1F67_11350 [Muribaculaceae bacterium]|nr:hypothetical protein [Muribaculaceae bacterium]
MNSILKNISIFSILLFFSCSYDKEPADIEKDLPSPGIEVVFPENPFKDVYVSTRAKTDVNDFWTMTGFSKGDRIGIYSYKGNLSNLDDPDHHGQIMNEYLEYGLSGTSSNSFNNPDLKFNAADVVSYTVNGYYVNYRQCYFPYCDNMPDPYTAYNDPNNKGKGLKLRVECEDGIERCVDLLYFDSGSWKLNANGNITGQLLHHFTSLWILRGEGFDNPDPNLEQIKVVLKEPVTHFKFFAHENNTYLISNWISYLTYDGEGDVASRNKERTWEAWEGLPSSTYGGRRMWYVVLPTRSAASASTGYTPNIPTRPAMEIDYIELYDNEGRLQRVSNFDLNYASTVMNKKLAPGYRFTLEIHLDGLEPKIKPFKVEKWQDEETITDERSVGIFDKAEFSQWLTAYNRFIQSNRSETDQENIDKLLNYGTATRDQAGKLQWTFYVTHDIELDVNNELAILRLEDNLEGASGYTRFSIANINKTFIGEITKTGKLKNLNFDNMYVTESTGGLIGKLSGGTIENCAINLGTVINQGPVGLLAGTVNGGNILQSVFSGFLYGSQTSQSPYSGLFSEEPTSNEIPYLDSKTYFKDIIFEAQKN